jgi:competence protein ComEC
LLQILYDPSSGTSISFQLSYLALLGILVLQSPLNDLMSGIIPQCLSTPLSASLGAFLATISITLVAFGSLRFAGIAAGLVMAPLTTLFMILSICYLALQLIISALPILGILGILKIPLNFALGLLYTLLGKTAAFAAKAPALESGSKIFVIAGIILPFAILYLAHKYKKYRSRVAVFE